MDDDMICEAAVAEDRRLGYPSHHDWGWMDLGQDYAGWLAAAYPMINRLVRERDEARATLDAVRELAGHWDDRQPNPWPKRGQRRTIAACLETHASELRRILDGAGAGDSDD